MSAKKFLSLFLAIAMPVSLLTIPALAEDPITMTNLDDVVAVVNADNPKMLDITIEGTDDDGEPATALPATTKVYVSTTDADDPADGDEAAMIGPKTTTAVCSTTLIEANAGKQIAVYVDLYNQNDNEPFDQNIWVVEGSAAGTYIFSASDPSGYGIQYAEPDPDAGIISPAEVVQGQLADANGTPGTKYGEKTDFELDLVNEVIQKGDTPITAKIGFISVDGGKKWKAFSVPEDGTGADISKLLNKGGEIWITTEYDKKAKLPQAYVPAAAATDDAPAVTSVAGAAIYKFPAIAARPKAPGFKPNYAKKADPTGATNGAWAPEEKKVLVPAADYPKYDIATSADGKKADATGWGKITAAGINVQDSQTPGKAEKNVFLVRVAPNLTPGTYAAASKSKKVTASSVIKAPTYKIDYKKGLIKPKEGAIHEIFSGDVSDNNPAVFTAADKTAFTKESAKAGLALVSTNAAGAEVNLYGKTLVFRTVGGKKAASAIQTVTVAPTADLHYSDVAALKVEAKGKFKPDKKFEVLGSDGKKIANDAAGGYIRIKNTAKYNAKTDATTGEPASRLIEFNFVMGEIGTEKKSKTGPVGIEIVVPKDENGVVDDADLLPDEAVLTGKAEATKPTALTKAAVVAKFTAYTPAGAVATDIHALFEVVVGGTTGLTDADFELADAGSGSGIIAVKVATAADGKPAVGDLTLTLKPKEVAIADDAAFEEYPKIFSETVTISDLKIEPVVTAAVPTGKTDTIEFAFTNCTGIKFNGTEIALIADGSDVTALFKADGKALETDSVSAAFDADKLTVTFAAKAIDADATEAITAVALAIDEGAFKIGTENIPVTLTGNKKLKIAQAAPATGTITITAE